MRAADGAKLPARKPSALPPAPQVIVQPVPTPTYEEFEDGDDDEAAPPPAWQQKVGEVVDQLLPVAKMVIGQKMADMMGGGAEVASPVDVTPAGAIRNAGDGAPADFVELSPESAVEQIDFAPAAWSHLATIVRKLGPSWKARIDAQLARMEAAERRDFVCSLVSLKLHAACDHVVAAVSVAEQRQTRGGAGEVARSTAMPASGPAVQATIRDMVEGAMGGGGTDAGVVDDAGDTAPPQGATRHEPLGGPGRHAGQRRLRDLAGAAPHPRRRGDRRGGGRDAARFRGRVRAQRGDRGGSRAADGGDAATGIARDGPRRRVGLGPERHDAPGRCAGAAHAGRASDGAADRVAAAASRAQRAPGPPDGGPAPRRGRHRP
ncbi:MAG: hypothetical protein IPH44_43415 [Myxococcales bacterium]|nr:hypothetical protein [Myxococcales bacterium]